MNKARIRTLVFSMLGAVAFWMAGDWGYARWVAAQVVKNEKHIQRDASGLRKGCEAFTIGKGDTAILMIHGFADSPAIFRPMASLLAQNGYTCRAMRLPGVGMPVEQARYVTRDMWENEIYLEIRKLRKTHSQVWLLGHSLGGGLATEVAAQHPQEVAGVVLLAPLFDVSSRRAPLLSARQWFDVANKTLLFTDVFSVTFPRDLKDHAALVDDLRDLFIPFNIYCELFKLVDSLPQSAPRVQRPLMVVVSEDDRVVDSDAARHFFHACASEKKLLLETREAGHVIPIDRGWETTAQAIERFIEQEHEEALSEHKDTTPSPEAPSA